MKNAIIIPNAHKDEGLSVTSRVVEKLGALGIDACVSREYEGKLNGARFYSEMPVADLIIVVGGDGSVIDASHYAISLDIPLLCVNLGKVGYLSAVEPDKLEVLELLSRGEYTVEEKMLLEIVGQGGGKYAVNDIVLSHESYLGIADIGLEDSVGNSIRYRADGVILSTPQGSTAYSFSAGGPVMAHNVDGIIVTPVCAHSLFNRSVIFSADEEIRLTNICIDDLNFSIDGRYFKTLKSGECATIRRAEKKLKMISFCENTMFSNLFGKMKMLEDTVR